MPELTREQQRERLEKSDIHDRIKARLEELRRLEVSPTEETFEAQLIWQVLIDRTRDWVDQKCEWCNDTGHLSHSSRPAPHDPCSCNRPTLLEETERRLNA